MSTTEKYLNIWEEKIADLKRFYLIGDKAEDEITSAPVRNLLFVKIESLLRSWDLELEKQRRNQQPLTPQDPKQGPKRLYPIEASIVGCVKINTNLAFLTLGSQKKIEYYFGSSMRRIDPNYHNDVSNPDEFINDNATVIKSRLAIVHRGIEYENKNYFENDIRQLIEPYANYVGVAVGIPALKVDNLDGSDYHQMDRIAGGLRKSKFGILTLANPIPVEYVLDELESVLMQIEKTQMAEDAQKKHIVKQYLELMEYYKNQVELGVYLGMSQTMMYFFAQDFNSFVQLEASLRANYCDTNSKPTPFRIVKSPNLRQHLLNFGFITNARTDRCFNPLMGYKYVTPLNSRQLSAYIHLPKQELPGLRIRRTANFTTSIVEPRNPARSIAVGNILDKRKDTNNLYRVDVDALQKHTLVCGVTGGGKTNTCFYLLGQIWKFNVPFMVIEPAKSEYRHMMLMSETFKGIGQAFSLGDETVSPFRLNPFEIMKGVKVQTHLDALKSVFNASFEMYAPMPQVMEKALNVIYTDRGWDLITNRNRRLPPHIKPGDPDCPPEIYPTMKDLYEVIDPVTESFGYSERIGPDVQAALKARIGSLLIGGKGQMLNTRRSIPPEILFGRPTVVELKMVSEDSEKSFLMGMLLVFLYEYRESLGPRDQLQHIMLVEEAHRLLKNVPTGQSGENANPAGKAVEFFTNMLAEIRSYGQGFIIADQIPNKLAPEALKNTNLKIMHRIVAKDDRDSMGDAMNMDDASKRHATALEQGQAIVYAERMEQPYHLAIMFDKTKEVPPPKTPEESNDIVRNAMKDLDIVGKFDKYFGCKDCAYRCDTYILALAKEVADDTLFRFQYNNFMLECLFQQESYSPDPYKQVEPAIITTLKKYKVIFINSIYRILRRRAKEGMVNGILWCLLTQATERYFERRGEFNYNFYDVLRKAYGMWLDILRKAYPDNDTGSVDVDLAKYDEWKNIMYTLRKRAAGPEIACNICEKPCQYGFEVKEYLRMKGVQKEFNDLFETSEFDPSVTMAKYAVKQANYFNLKNTLNLDFMYCLCVNQLKNMPLSYSAQKVLLRKTRNFLPKEIFDSFLGKIIDDVFSEIEASKNSGTNAINL